MKKKYPKDEINIFVIKQFVIQNESENSEKSKLKEASPPSEFLPKVERVDRKEKVK